MKLVGLTLATLALLLGGVRQARADVLYDNLSATTDNSDSVGTVGPLGDSFSTGASAAILVDVKVLLSGTSNGGSTVVELLSDNSNTPGTVLTTIGTLSDASLTGTDTVFDFPLGTPFGLVADTRYWIQLSSSDASGANWDYSSDVSGVGVANEFFAINTFVSPNTLNGGPHQMQVNVVPEPSGLALLGLGAAGLWMATRRRRKA